MSALKSAEQNNSNSLHCHTITYRLFDDKSLFRKVSNQMRKAGLIMVWDRETRSQVQALRCPTQWCVAVRDDHEGSLKQCPQAASNRPPAADKTRHVVARAVR